MKGPGRIQRAILAHLQRADVPTRGATIRALAIAVYNLRPPEEPTTDQALTVRRAVRGLERRGLVTTRVRVRARPTRDVVGGAVTGGRGAVHRGMKLGRYETTVVALAAEGGACRICMAPIEQPAGAGRPRVYCSDQCRAAAYHRGIARRRRAQAAAGRQV
jgi:hypothetical protein